MSDRKVNTRQQALVWGMAAGALGMAACGAFGKILYGLIVLVLGTVIGYIAGIILEKKQK
ncbi:MAG: hypothetical protein VZT48_00405 [Bulleidia sp.]|nr:hypothetical protein [Bulleidia sp.]